ncbi:coenzyme PQQ biosynthesis protein B [Gluconacetobacter diazotrophicus PA1 5]|uniref:Coenzyme PQQ synthesis protein B n=2 Tax=Gluconacetobacter diazotrophicus TaxID=33996 RepID=PQQB_GLUDA|nr:pyrroloquinoline quinone biosynthesis protein PqqB [Gluconacetobacter diazotrophicus]A9HEC4.1 RecName: Full=Coenzyme PQQ synthesis protein B; AltName: Full=Pyrroloquinoline quinone biosynthesis protein B [Gluconacetobacter diazotrophicus PA1 5]ACI51741.1 coenzyme PQQ biosynthesis protein B [Gluconacetobacter diazotrophicus PA1 5]MBB2155219.1 pyrroloquinoline quinone biosynthesis protein PqqB [Gluconacetobacter diazotrophicus]TWB11085.1 pyrroloquinoline quinone biosynthesis protein B [Glucona
MIDLIVLGAAAGGGFPQWNSNAPACRRARADDPAAPSRTQASIAVSGDGAHWFVVNASPDLRAQIGQTPALHPRHGLRSTPIAGVILTGGEVDTVTGLLTLRERQPFTLLATPPVLDLLDANPIFEALDRSIVPRVPLALDQPFALALPDGTPAGLTITPFAVPGKVPLYAESGPDPAAIVENGETIGLAMTDGVRHAYFIPGCARMTGPLRARLRGADLVFFDGTLWTDDEMLRAGVGQKTGQRMGHMSVSGDGGTIDAFADLDVRRKVLIHINNSNPLLLADSPERQVAHQAGWEVSFDGMRITT